jgi:hypothetical protein
MVVALGLVASLLGRCISPALPGLMVGIEPVIVWTAGITSLFTLLAATGIVAGLARMATAIVAAPRAPLVARVVVVPAVSLGCMLLLFASFRQLEPLLALLLGVSSALVGGLAARHTIGDRQKRAGALVLALTSGSGLVHVLARKLTQDASDAANLAAFRSAQWIETLGLILDLVALALTLVWLRRRATHGRWLVPLVLALSAVCVVLGLRGSLPNANTLSVLLARSFDKLGRDQTSLLPLSFSHLLGAAGMATAFAALVGGGGELGLVLAACLAARSALDIPVPALLLELGALYLPFARTSPAAPRAEPTPAPVPDTSPP